VNARDPETGGISKDVTLYQEMVERIREPATDVMINITTGGGEDFIQHEENRPSGGEGTDIQPPEARHAPIGKLLPEKCALDCGSTNFGNMLYMSPTDWLEKQAKLVQDSGVKPELECFDTGHLRFANHLVEKGLID